MLRLNPSTTDSLGPVGLAAAIAHEVRRLLTPARAYSELALHQTGLTAEVAQSLQATIAAAVACDQVMECLTAIHGTATEVCDPAEVVAHLAKQDHGLKITVEPCVVPLSAAALEVILANLVNNARRASAGEAKIVVRIRSTGNTIAIEVQDQGIGMTEVECRRSLQPFVSNASSSGMGLAICRYLVERAGGAISIASRPGAGTKVIVELPRVDALKQSA